MMFNKYNYALNDYKKEARKSFLHYVVDINAMENNQFDQSLIRLSKQ